MSKKQKKSINKVEHALRTAKIVAPNIGSGQSGRFLGQDVADA
jgi:hypothetical protein